MTPKVLPWERPLNEVLPDIRVMNHLSKFYCRVYCYCESDIFRNIYEPEYTSCEAVFDMLKKMPKLQLFGIEQIFVPHQSSCRIFDFVRRVIDHVMSQDKQVLIVANYQTTEGLRVKRKEDHDEFLKRETFKIRLTVLKSSDPKRFFVMDSFEEYLKQNMVNDVVFFREVEN